MRLKVRAIDGLVALAPMHRQSHRRRHFCVRVFSPSLAFFLRLLPLVRHLDWLLHVQSVERESPAVLQMYVPATQRRPSGLEWSVRCLVVMLAVVEFSEPGGVDRRGCGHRSTGFNDGRGEHRLSVLQGSLAAAIVSLIIVTVSVSIRLGRRGEEGDCAV